MQDEIPAPKKRPVVEEVTEAAIIIHWDDQIFLRQRAEGERWAGLWDFPRFTVAADDAPNDGVLPESLASAVQSATGITVELLRRLTTLRHGVTRFRITLHCYQATRLAGRAPRAATTAWLRPQELADYPLSVTGRKISRLLLEDHR